MILTDWMKYISFLMFVSYSLVTLRIEKLFLSKNHTYEIVSLRSVNEDLEKFEEFKQHRNTASVSELVPQADLPSDQPIQSVKTLNSNFLEYAKQNNFEDELKSFGNVINDQSDTGVALNSYFYLLSRPSGDEVRLNEYLARTREMLQKDPDATLNSVIPALELVDVDRTTEYSGLLIIMKDMSTAHPEYKSKIKDVLISEFGRIENVDQKGTPIHALINLDESVEWRQEVYDSLVEAFPQMNRSTIDEIFKR